MSKIQISKQITTFIYLSHPNTGLYSICQRYRFQSKLQPMMKGLLCSMYCIQYVKDTDFKANYNGGYCPVQWQSIVFNMSKIQISKQITTRKPSIYFCGWLYSICQRYRFQSKLQPKSADNVSIPIVFNMSKIQISKQITT